MSYFECNLPEKCPAYIHPSKAAAFEETVRRIERRMKKLDDALEITGMDGATFARLCKVLFDSFFERFESCSAEELAEWTAICYDGKWAEPRRLEWPNAEVVVDCAFVQRGEWETLRHFGLGGSDAAVAFGYSPYQTAQELYHNKVGTPPLMPDKSNSKAVFDRGHILEDDVINVFCDVTGFKRIPETRMFRSKKYPHVTANIYGILKSPDGKRLFVFEAKSTIAENYDAWADGKIPRHYLPQMRQYPAVLDDDRICGTYIGCLFTVDITVCNHYLGSSFAKEQFVSRVLDRSQDMEEEHMKQAEAWWQQYIEAQKEPPPAGIRANRNGVSQFVDINVLRKYHTGPANADKPALDLTLQAAELIPLAQQYLSLGEDRKVHQSTVDALKDRQDQISMRFMECLGDSTCAKIDMGDGSYYEIKWSPRSYTKTDVEKLKLAFPAAYEDCVETIPENSRVFSLRKKEVRKKSSKK